MAKKVVLWTYLPGQKRVIVEETIANGRQIMFFNKYSKEFEFIDSDFRKIGTSLDDFEGMISGDEIHILHTGGHLVKDLANMLKKKNIRLIEKKETYT